MSIGSRIGLLLLAMLLLGAAVLQLFLGVFGVGVDCYYCSEIGVWITAIFGVLAVAGFLASGVTAFVASILGRSSLGEKAGELAILALPCVALEFVAWEALVS